MHEAHVGIRVSGNFAAHKRAWSEIRRGVDEDDVLRLREVLGEFWGETGAF
jgi:hypothetical protein